jgi:hypothetical protein
MYWNKGNAGLDILFFSKFSESERKKILRLCAVVMESAYRRGVQQALHLNDNGGIDDWILKDVHKYRYGKSLSRSIGLDGYETSSIERLKREHDIFSYSFD